jgi:protein TonB
MRVRSTAFAAAVFLLFLGMACDARAAQPAGCPIVLDRVIEVASSGHDVDVTLIFLGDAIAFSSYDVSGRWTHGTTRSRQPSITFEGTARPFVASVSTGYDDRTHGRLLDAWVSDVVETDGTHVACPHASAMQRSRDRLFPGAIELTSREALRTQTAYEKTVVAPSPTPSAAPTASPPVPQASPALSPDPQTDCPVPNGPASIVTYVRAPYPDMARQEGAGGTTLVLVSLDAQGINRAESVYRSSGNALLDQSALSAARQSTYAPAFARCVPVPGQIIYRADF